MENKKKCPSCHQIKSFDSFNRKSKDKPALQSYCKSCHLVKHKKYREANPEKFRSTIERTRKYADDQEMKRSHSLMSKYGITVFQFDDILKKQNYKCAACSCEFETRKQTHVDHCHKSKNVRGILCMNCNVTLGYAKEDVKRLRSLIDYLIKSK